MNININLIQYIFVKIIIILIIILIINKYMNNNNIENFNLEGTENINSLYNENNLIIGNVSVESFNLLPSGCIVAWTQQTVPIGWTLCDGTKNTPDLRGRFIIGSGNGNGLTNRIMGQTGGEENHLLTLNEIPAHGHEINGGSDFNVLFHSGGGNCNEVLISGNSNYMMTDKQIISTQEKINPNIQVSSENNNQAHNNMPPYYILYYIMKI
jgi:microcystin-dependent protein